MKHIRLIKVEHQFKIGDKCPYIEPNVTESAVFYEGDKPIGFYLTKMPQKMCVLANIANTELRSKNVPKTEMNRGTEKQAKAKGQQWISQYSTILGAVPPKPHMKRNYATLSSVHLVKSAQTFVKAMLALAKESENLIKELIPEQYERQLQLLQQVPEKWRFGNLFTSSISNYNISVPFHRDTANILDTVNVIICKKMNSKGGDLHIPDYGVTIGQQDNSILAYPVWRNVHGVTPIIPTHPNGYRNSLVFYPLKAFCIEK